MVFHLLLSICLSVHFFCCSFLYFLYRYTGMPIMTLRQMMIKTLASNTLLIDAHFCSLYSNFFPHFGQYSKSSVVV